MFTLIKAEINKYKSYSTKQAIEIDKDITTLVGKNESGKTAFLEALAKLNYFTTDQDFEFDLVPDYPRNELKKHKRSGEKVAPMVCTFQLDQDSINEINSSLGKGVLTTDQFKVERSYSSELTWYFMNSDQKKYLENLQLSLNFSDATKANILSYDSVSSIFEIDSSDNTELQSVIEHIQNTLTCDKNQWNSNLIDGHIIEKYIRPCLPKFWYFDEYYELPSRVSIDDVRNNSTSDEFTKQQLDTAKALFELAGIDAKNLDHSADFESFIAELEATSIEITDKIFQYWSTNKGLSIDFKIESILNGNNRPPEQILDIRVKNDKHRISLPLKKRSKGFNWFFSFIVWFSKIQNESQQSFILLLDEPGLNLHASAQADLLRFINDLSKDHQIIYSTHSPFMVEADQLQRVRTVYDSENGSIISDAIQEKDPDTLFPLQAALGYDIAQNLFVSKNNLLVEGPADLNYLTFMSNLLDNAGRIGLRTDIMIVPVGGLDKVVSFVSLLRGSKLKISCLLDSFNNAAGAQRLDSLIQTKIIKNKNVRFFDEFAGDDYNQADIEDLFEKSEFLKIFGKAYPDHKVLTVTDLDKKKPTILLQLKAIRKGKDFNHYKPSQILLGMGLCAEDFSEKTLNKFETMFKEVNSLY